MQELETRARLVEMSGDSVATRGPTAVLPRAEIEEAMESGDGPATLVLEIARADGEGGATPEARVTVDWDRAELEELLRASESNQIMLSFDEEELARLLEESDVDAHGLRERAAVLGIVVATAGAAAGGAFAHPQDIGDGSVGATTANTPSFITDSRGGDGGAAPAPEATSFITDSRGGDGGLAPAPEGTTSFVTDSRGGDGGLAPAPEGTTSFITDSRGGDGGLAPAPDDGTSISLPSPEQTAGIAGLALLITAAGFVASRTRRHPELPA